MPLPTKDMPLQHWLTHPDMPTLPHSLAVGWSGGADSTALLLALQQAGYDVQAWHIDHAWRASSRQEAESLAHQASLWGIPFLTARLNAPSGNNREAEARHGRLQQFQRWGQQHNINTLCLAQHLDDQAETVCMRLLQGAGVLGCQGMRRERQFDTLRIVRPLLHVSMQDLRQALTDAGIIWFEDPSNTDISIWRNRIRHQLFPAIEQAGVAPQTLFLRWQQQAVTLAQRIEHDTDLLWCKVQVEDNHIMIKWSLWIACSGSIRARLLQRFIAQLFTEGVTPGRRHIELVEFWSNKNGRGGLDLSRCRLYRSGGCLHLQPTKAGSANRHGAADLT